MIVRFLFLSKLFQTVGAGITLAILVIGFLLVLLVTTILLRAAHALFNLIARNQGLHEAQFRPWSWGDALAAGFAVLVVWHATAIVAGHYVAMDIARTVEQWRLDGPDATQLQLTSMLTLPFGLFAVTVTLRTLLRTTFAKALSVATLYVAVTVGLALALAAVVGLLFAK